MKFDFKNKSKEEKVRIIIVVAVIFICVFLGVFASIIFPGTQFAGIIDNSIGKFFNVVNFFTNNYVTILESVAVVIFIWIIYKILIFIVLMFIKRGHRSETIGNLILSTVKYVSVIAAIFLILSAWGVQTPTLLAGAGIIGLAISFGAQSLIEAIFAGLFIIFEKQFAVGDVIEIGDFRGVVKELGLRIPKFKDMKETISTIKKGPFYDGIEEFGDSGITIRVVAWVKETDRLHTVREMNKHLKIMFDKNNIEIPFPQIVVHKQE